MVFLWCSCGGVFAIRSQRHASSTPAVSTAGKVNGQSYREDLERHAASTLAVSGKKGRVAQTRFSFFSYHQNDLTYSLIQTQRLSDCKNAMIVNGKAPPLRSAQPRAFNFSRRGSCVDIVLVNIPLHAFHAMLFSCVKK